jgi:hypothetical protein
LRDRGDIKKERRERKRRDRNRYMIERESASVGDWNGLAE